MTFKAVVAVIPVQDLDVAARWYESFFGRPADQRPMDGLAEWQLSDLGLVQVLQDPRRAGQTLTNFTVDDLDTIMTTLAGAGITVTDPQIVSSGRQRLTTTTDIDGNTLGLIQIIG